jgi:Protein of unknown function (DUF3738)
MNSDHFDVQATTDSTATVKQLEGPTLQALLEDRFQLKVHRASVERPCANAPRSVDCDFPRLTGDGVNWTLDWAGVESAKALVEILVIDQVEQPSEN